MIIAYWLIIILLGIAGILYLGDVINDIWESDKMKGDY